MPYALLIIGLMVLVYGPSLWVKAVMRRHSGEREGMPGSGGELAQHLIERFELTGYSVEVDPNGVDHFSPADKAVRLSKQNFEGKSLTAVAVAAHEVGHALQCHRDEAVFRLRSRYLPTAARLKRVGIVIIMLFPLAALLLKSPAVIAVVVGFGLVLQFIGVLMYLIVLPEEWDASFNKALPLLNSGYLPEEYQPAVRQVLKAAALTYFAAALADVLNIARWFLLLIRR